MEGRRGLPERDGGGRERLPFKAEKGALLRVRMRGLGRETERETCHERHDEEEGRSEEPL